jgi:hypothetical protein
MKSTSVFGDDQVDTRDSEQPLDPQIIVCCLGNLSAEKIQIIAQPIELAQVPLDCGALVIRHDLFRQPDPAQSPE